MWTTPCSLKLFPDEYCAFIVQPYGLLAPLKNGLSGTVTSDALGIVTCVYAPKQPAHSVPTVSCIDTAIPNGSPNNAGGVFMLKFCGWSGRLSLPVPAFSFFRRNVSAFVVFSTMFVRTGVDVASVVPLVLFPPTVCAATLIDATVETCSPVAGPLAGAVKRRSVSNIAPGVKVPPNGVQII